MPESRSKGWASFHTKHLKHFHSFYWQKIKMAVSLSRNLSNWLPCNYFEVNADKVLKLTIMSNAKIYVANKVKKISTVWIYHYNLLI